MSKTFKFTDYFDSPESDVIESVYYNSGTYELFVVTNRDDAYGYDSVPNYLFNHFKNAASKGHFWNTAVKGRYKNVSRGEDVDFVNANYVAPAKPVYANAFAAPVADAEYVVTFEVSGTLTVTGTADNIDDAVAKATKIVNEQLAGNFKVKEVTKKFV
jgi:hypothetical protein